MNLGFYFLFFIPYLYLVAETYPLSWPIKGKGQISSTFGESRIDHFHNGLDIPGDNLAVYPLKEGEVFFVHEAIHYPNELPFGGGKTILLRHNLYLTGYMHLKEFHKKNVEKRTVKLDESLAFSGNTGHSGSAHLHFFLLDIKKKHLLNPLRFLSSDFYEDSTPPKPGKIGVVLADRISFVNPHKEFRMTQNYPLAIELVDSGKKNERWGIYKLEVANPLGQILHFVEFDILVFQDKQWRTKNGLSFSEVYHGPYYLLGNKIRQNKEIEIKARGFSGPEYREKFSFKILLE